MRRPITAILAAALLVALLAPAHAGAARGMELAIQDDAVYALQAYYDRTKALDKAEKLHVSWIRVNVGWQHVVNEPNRRRPPKHLAYDFSRFDSLIDAAAQRGIKVQMALTGPAPAWAAGNRRSGPYKPNASYFGRFARSAADHFKGRVTRYSIWNEPNHIAWLAPKSKQGSLYRALYLKGYSAIKGVDPANQVLIGETAPYASRPKLATPPLQFLRAVTCVNQRYRAVKRCRLFADGFAHHPYDYLHSPTYRFPGRDNVTMRGLPKLTRALTLLGRRHILRTPQGRPLDVYLTEFGYFASGKYRLPARKRAKYLVKAFQIAQRNGRVKQMLQYLLARPDKQHRFFDTSLLSGKGGETYVFRKLVQWAKKAAAAGKIATAQKPPPPPPPPPSDGGGGGSGGGGGGGEPPPPTQPPPPPPPPDPGCVILPPLPCPTLP